MHLHGQETTRKLTAQIDQMFDHTDEILPRRHREAARQPPGPRGCKVPPPTVRNPARKILAFLRKPGLVPAVLRRVAWE
jgi:hypothetical protein